MSQSHVLLARDAGERPALARAETHAQEAANDFELTPDPTHSELRLRRPAEIGEPRATRPSIRPSAFGPPRPSSRPPQAAAAGLELSVELDADAEQEANVAAGAPLSTPPAAGSSRRSLLRSLAGLFSLRSGGSRGSRQDGPRRPLFGIAVVCSMLTVSAFMLLRNTLPSDASAKSTASVSEARRALQAASALAPQPRVVVMQRDWSDNESAERPQAEAAQPGPQLDLPEQILALRREADRAFAHHDIAQAEQLYGRIMELEDGNPRAAFGFARIQLQQGDLAAAERWVQLAIRKRPRRASYHALYAEILTRLGRDEEAVQEQLRAADGVQTGD